jgi:cytochrome bd-type quinol oxidase subunit 1
MGDWVFIEQAFIGAWQFGWASLRGTHFVAVAVYATGVIMRLQ